MRQKCEGDVVSFSSSLPKGFAVSKKAAWQKDILSTREIQLQKILDGGKREPFSAYMFQVGKDSTESLVVTNSKGKVLGKIQELDPGEWECDKDKRKVGKYLTLNMFNASYPDSVGIYGIGTALINEAVQISKNLGFHGQLRVSALNCFNPDRGSPVPFYAKKGFIDIENPLKPKEKLIEEYIQESMSKESLDMYLLTPERLQRLKKAALSATKINILSGICK